MPLDLPTGSETSHGQVRQKVNNSLTYLDGKPSGSGSAGPKGDTGPAAVGAKWVSSFTGISGITFPALVDGGPAVLEVHGYYAESDCPVFYMKRRNTTTEPVDPAYAGKLTTASADGQVWEYLVDGGVVHFKHTGAKPDNATDIVPYFNAFKLFFLNKWFSNNGMWFPRLDFSYPQNNNSTTTGGIWSWYQASPLQLKGGRFHLYGDGSGQAGGDGPRISADIGYPQVILDDQDTEMGAWIAPVDRDLPGADGSIIEGLTFSRYGIMTTDPDEVYDGILARTRFDLRRCRIYDAARAALFVYGDVAAGGGGNANCFTVTDCLFADSQHFGIWTFGSDANAGSFNGTITCTRNGRGAIFDQSFLGNAYAGQVHTDGNAYNPRFPAPYPMSARYNNKVYRVVPRQEVAASTTTPGTNNAVWEYDRDEFGANTWVTGQTWLSGGDIIATNSNNRNGFFNVYCEGGAWPVYLVGRAVMHDGGCRDAVGVSDNSTAQVWKDGRLLAGKFQTRIRDGALGSGEVLDSTLGARGDSLNSILSAKRILTEQSSAIQSQINLRSYGDGTFGWDNVSNDGVAAANAGYRFLGPAVYLDEDAEFTAENLYGGHHIPRLWVGRVGYQRPISSAASNPTSLGGVRGQVTLQERPRPGGEEGWRHVAGTDTSVAQALRCGYVEWAVSATYDPPSLAAGAVSPTQTISAPGAVLGDQVAFRSFSLDQQGVHLNAWVSAADTVSYRFENPPGASTVDLGSGTVKLYLRRASDTPAFVSAALTPPVSLDFAANYNGFTIYGLNSAYVVALNPTLASISSGKLRLTSATGSSTAYGWYPTASARLMGLTVGETYRLGFDWAGTAGTQRVRVGGNATGEASPLVNDLQAGASGSYLNSFIATRTTHFVALSVDAETAGVVGDFDNFTVALSPAQTLPVSETFASSFANWEISAFNTSYVARSNRARASIVSGKLRLTGATASGSVYSWDPIASLKVSGLTVGAKYLLGYDFTTATADAAHAMVAEGQLGESASYDRWLPGTSGAVATMFEASATTMHLCLQTIDEGSSGISVDWDNVSMAVAVTSGDAALPVNETFASDYGRWSIYGTNNVYALAPNAALASLVSGKLRLTSDTGPRNGWYPTASLRITGLTIGVTYHLGLDWVASVATTAIIRVGDVQIAYPDPILEAIPTGTSGTYAGTFVATATSHYLAIAIDAEVAGRTLDIDNVTVTT